MPPPAAALTVTLALPAFEPEAVEDALPPVPPEPVVLKGLPPQPPLAVSTTVTSLFPRAMPVDWLVASPPRPNGEAPAEKSRSPPSPPRAVS
jgi:hypothetical protein